MRKPRPSLATRNSPIITPTQDRPTLIFRAETKVGIDAGKIKFVRIWLFLAPKVFNNFILSSSTSLKPFKTDIIVTTTEISRAITIIAVIPLATNIKML